MAEAAVGVFGVPAGTDAAAVRAVEPWGKTDRWILGDLLAATIGRSEPPAADELARWEASACAIYDRIEDGEADAGDRATAEVLAQLADEGHDLSLVTGNLEPIARRKLGARGLGRFFPEGQGGFGSDAVDRAELVRIALERAGSPPAAGAALIGDTPRDVAAALAGGVRAIGVAGGRYSRDDLLRSGASAAIGDLSELPQLL
jgi:phosphoglycolate phosphatase